MKLASLIICIGIAFLFHRVNAQTPEIERLLKTAEAASGKEKIIALAEVCKFFYSIDPHKGIEIGKEALHLADSLEIPSVKSKAYNCIGVNYWALSDFPTARLFYDSAFQNATLFRDTFEIGIFYNRMGLMYESQGYFDSSLLVFRKELDIYRQLQEPERVGNALENIGTIHLNRGEFKSAISYLIEAISVLEKAGITKKLPYIYLKLGQIYSELQDFTTAEESFRKGIDQSLALKNLNIAGIGYNALGILYKNQGRYEESITQFTTALKTIQGMNNRKIIMAVYGNMGNVYLNLKKFPEALDYHQKSLALAVQLNQPLDIARQQVNMGQDYYYMKEYSTARSFYLKALPAFHSGKIQSDLLTTYKALIDVNDSLKDYSKSVQYYQLYMEVKDSLNKHELNTALDSLRVKFNTEQTENENIVLTQQAEMQRKTISLQQILMVSSFVVIILFVTLVIVIIRSSLKVKKANELLEIKNLDILAKADELSRVNDKLLELSKFKDSMNSFLVHDLKNPLNAIINFDPRQFSEHQVEVLKHSGKQMMLIVMNLLDISKYEHQTMKVSAENVSVTGIINRAFADIEYLAERKYIRLKINYQTDFIVLADPEIIERVFVNLFSNAIRFSSISEAIQVFAECVNQTHVKITVKDRGEGIDDAFLPVIFDRFTQAHEKKSGVARSTGIGLTFCKMAVEAHSGEIGVDSVVGQGASFWFTLPLAASQSGLKIDPASFVESTDKFSKLQLSEKEISALMPHCELLKKIHINQISDVKDVIKAIDVQGSANITAWRSELLQALSECNEVKYHELINL